MTRNSGAAWGPAEEPARNDKNKALSARLKPRPSENCPDTRDFIEAATKECGSSGRTYKSALIWSVPDSPDSLRDEARKVLAWEDISDEGDDLRLDEAQKRQLSESVKRAQRGPRAADFGDLPMPKFALLHVILCSVNFPLRLLMRMNDVSGREHAGGS